MKVYIFIDGMPPGVLKDRNGLAERTLAMTDAVRPFVAVEYRALRTDGKPRAKPYAVMLCNPSRVEDRYFAKTITRALWWAHAIGRREDAIFEAEASHGS